MNETTFVKLFMLILIVFYFCYKFIERSRIKKANMIAKYMVDIGISNTTTGNYIFTYSEINQMFKTNLPNDFDLLSEIVDVLYNRYDSVIADLDFDWVRDGSFDFIFYLDYCPNLQY